MIKLLHIISDTNIGGAGRLLLNQLRKLDRARFEPIVALPSGSRLLPELQRVSVRTVELTHGADRSWERGAVRELWRLIRAERPDIVHTHASVAGRLAAYLGGVPARVYTRHCVFPLKGYQKKALFRLLYGKIGVCLSPTIVAVAEAARENLRALGVGESHISVIVNGVEPLTVATEEEKSALRLAYGIPREAFVVGIYARLVPYKGHETLLTAAAACLQRGGEYRFLIVGEGESEGALRARAHALGIADKVIFTGFVPDVTPLMNLTDLNINASYGTETSSLALSEGMSLGIPAVVTDYGGNSVMVRDGACGFVVPVGDAERMADAIARLAEDRALYEKMRRGARARYEEGLTADAMTRAMEALYEESLKKYAGK